MSAAVQSLSLADRRISSSQVLFLRDSIGLSATESMSGVLEVVFRHLPYASGMTVSLFGSSMPGGPSRVELCESMAAAPNGILAALRGSAARNV